LASFEGAFLTEKNNKKEEEQVKNYYLKLIAILIATISLTASHVFAEEPLLFGDLQLPGMVSGKGTHFEITDSDYLNVTLDSTEQVVLLMASLSNMIDISLETDSVGLVTDLTVGGLLPNTIYYMYLDDYHNLTQSETDALGSYTFSYDSAVYSKVIIQDEPSTYYINALDGGDCSSLIGTWDPGTLTCTLTADVSETIQIDSDGITLDGNMFIATRIYATQHSEITVKNFAYISQLDISGTWRPPNNSISGLTVTDNIYIKYLRVHSLIGDVNIESNNIYKAFISVSYFLRENNISNFRLTENIIDDLCALSFLNDVSITHNEINYLRFHHLKNVSFYSNMVDLFYNAFGAVGYIFDNTIASYNDITWDAPDFDDVIIPYEFFNNNIGSVERGYLAIFRYNHYDEYDEPAEDCYDINTDGYCDAPYEIPGAASPDAHDPFARITPIGSDATPPTTTHTFGGAIGDNNWFVSDVTVSLTAADGESGVSEIHYFLDGAETVVSADSASFTVIDEGVHTLTYYAVDLAGNEEAMHGPVSFNIDKTPPVISITGVTDGAEYPVCTPPEALDNIVTDAISGVSTKNATLEGGNANGVGGYTYTVIASDNAGNEANESVSYSVVYSFDGFTNPVTLDKPFKLGSTIPVKFLLSDGCGGAVSNAEANISLVQLNSGEPAGDPIDGTTNVPDSSNIFRYVIEDSHYIYNLSTENLSSGTWRINVTLDDGKVYSVDIGIK
jgi:hypothetical protein